MMPAAMIAATASPALPTSSNEAMTTRASCGSGHQLDRTSVTTSSRPSEPIDERQQVEAGGVQSAAAELDAARRRS